jgi:hypothetical protein
VLHFSGESGKMGLRERDMGGISFSAKLVRLEDVGMMTYVGVPFDVEKAFGRGGPVKVKASLNGVAFRGSLLPNGDGNHFLVVAKPVRDKAKVKVGDRVKIILEADPGARAIEPPPDLAKALAKNKSAKQAWDAYPHSHRKSYVDWIVAAMRDDTRAGRVAKAVVLMAEKKTLR